MIRDSVLLVRIAVADLPHLTGIQEYGYPVVMKATIEIPDDLYRRVKARSAMEGLAVREVAVTLFHAWVEKDAIPEKEAPASRAPEQPAPATRLPARCPPVRHGRS